MKSYPSNFAGTCYLVAALAFFGLLGSALVFPAGCCAMKTRCLSNLKQIGNATLAYSADFDDRLPPVFTFDIPQNSSREAVAKSFMALIEPHFKNKYPHDGHTDLWLCKQDEDHKVENPAEGVNGVMSYVHCLALRGIIPVYSTGGRVIDLSDKLDWAKIGYIREPIRGTDKFIDPSGLVHKNVLASAHGPGTTILYLDSHVKHQSLININADL